MTDTDFPDAQAATLAVLRPVALLGVIHGTKPRDEFPAESVPVLPYVMVRAGSAETQWPVLETVSLRVTVWHQSEASALALARRERRVLLAYLGGTQVRKFGAPLTGPVPTVDPVTGDSLATFTITARLCPIPV